MNKRYCGRRQYQTAIWAARERANRTIHRANVAKVNWCQLNSGRCSRGLDRAEQADSGGICRIPNDRRARHVGRDLLEQIQPFTAKAVFERSKTGGVAAWPREAINKA